MIVKAISYLKLVLILHSLYFRNGGKCEYYKLLRLLALMTWSIRGGAKEAVNYGQSWFSVAHEYYEILIIVVGIVLLHWLFYQIASSIISVDGPIIFGTSDHMFRRFSSIIEWIANGPAFVQLAIKPDTPGHETSNWMGGGCFCKQL